MAQGEWEGKEEDDRKPEETRTTKRTISAEHQSECWAGRCLSRSAWVILMSDRQGEGGGRQSKVCGSRALDLLCWTGLFRWLVGDNILGTGVFVPRRQTVWECEALRDIGWTGGWSVVTGWRRGRGQWVGNGHKKLSPFLYYKGQF